MVSPEEAQELLQRATSGDDKAREALFASCQDKLKAMVRFRIDPRIRQRVDPSDVVQDAMANAAARLTEFVDHGGEHFYVWLRKIAWERLVQLHRHHVQAKKRTIRHCPANSLSHNNC